MVVRGRKVKLLAGASRNEYPTGDVILLNDATVNDDLIASMRQMPHLTAVALKSTVITAQQLSEIVNSRDIEWIDLEGSPVSDDVVRVLCRLPSIKRLNLSGTAISNSALECISTLPNLEVLDVSNTRVSPPGIMRLTALQTLKELRIDGVRLSEREAAEIETAFSTAVLVW
jgi:Leucine-rich repeat (LRR) protein